MITDIDKTNHHRIQPSPNIHDAVLNSGLGARGTNSVNYITPATNQALVAGALDGQFSIVKTGTFLTDFFTSVIPAAGQYGNSTNLIATIPHGLTFIPGLTLYLDSGSFGQSPAPYHQYAKGVGTAYWYVFRGTVDATNIYVYVDFMGYGTGSAFGQFPFRYYLLRQTPS